MRYTKGGEMMNDKEIVNEIYKILKNNKLTVKKAIIVLCRVQDMVKENIKAAQTKLDNTSVD